MLEIAEKDHRRFLIKGTEKTRPIAVTKKVVDFFYYFAVRTRTDKPFSGRHQGQHNKRGSANNHRLRCRAFNVYYVLREAPYYSPECYLN